MICRHVFTRIKITLLAGLFTALVACHVYHPDVQQGNALTAQMVGALQKGQTKNEVRRILGNSVIQQGWQSPRWDYVYVFRSKGKMKERHRLTLHFDEEGKLTDWVEKKE